MFRPFRGIFSRNFHLLFNDIHTSSNSSLETGVRSYEEIPMDRSLLPAVVRLLLGGGAEYLHEHCDKLHKKLGPIFRESLGPKELIFIADNKFIQTVIASEGQYPHHNIPDSWLYYNELKKVQRGIFFQSGEPWDKLRKAFNKVMLADPAKVNRFSSDIIDTNSDLLDLWRSKYEQPLGDIVIDDVRPDLCKWSIETTGIILFGDRMGCVPKNADSRSFGEIRAEKLVRNVTAMFDQTSRFQVIPVKLAHKLGLGVWKRFEAASSEMLQLATKYTNENLGKIKQSNGHVSLVKDLLDMRTLEDEDVTRSIVDLIIAAADTTSNSLQWMLYLLAKYPESQDKIRQETSSLLQSRDGADNIREAAPYLVAFVQEAFRLYPTAPFLARTLSKEVVLANYQVPPGTPLVFSLYTTSRMEQYFERPLEFIPSRWLRTGDRKIDMCQRARQAYASLPFGAGVRMCVGRRAAELEIYLFLASLVNRFRCSVNGSGDIEARLRMILCPTKPIGLILKPRE